MPAAATAVAAGSLPVTGAAGARVPGDRRGSGHDTRRRARALPPRGQAIEGAFAVNDDAMLQDAKLRELAHRLGAAAAERLDVERTAGAVVERPRTERRSEPLTWVQPAWRRSAALAILLHGCVLG